MATTAVNDRMNPELRKKITVQHRFPNIEEATYQTLLDKIEYFLSTKAHSYLKGELQHPDAEMLINVDLKKNDWWMFEWHFDFIIKTGRDTIRYQTDKPFKNLEDIVSHAFQHLKERLSWEKKWNHRRDR